MKVLSASSLLASAALLSSVSAQCQFIGGNYYCNQVEQVVYEGIGFSGSYNQVTNFDESSCSCSNDVFSFSGTLAPLNEELSVHFRGPVNLKRFAVYFQGSSSQKKRDAAPEADCNDPVAKRHLHHVHKRKAEPVVVTEVVNVYKTVFDGGDGAVDTAAAAVNTPAATEVAGNTLVTSVLSNANTVNSVPEAASTGASSPTQSVTGDGWILSSSYDSSSGQADNLVFLNNQGGTAGSGTWSSCFGNSLSFCASDGVSGAGSPQALSDVTVPSNTEYIIFSGQACNNGDCGYTRPGIPAYHGFSGDTKMFLFEFAMPTDSAGAGSFNGDMPAIWFLNAQIPRTLQYGAASCSCWTTGCGEFDIFEVLNSGNDKLTNHFHSGQNGNSDGSGGGGGTADYFARPTSGTLVAAVIFENGQVTITSIPSDVAFSSSFSIDTVQQWISSASSSSTTVSI